MAGSPLLDGGDVALLPKDVSDVDRDGDTEELLPLDLAGNARVIGGGLDIGAFEFVSDVAMDSDGDGLSDSFELAHGETATSLEAGEDLDGDGLTNFEEFVYGLDPNQWDAAQELSVSVLAEGEYEIRFGLSPEATPFVEWFLEGSFDLGETDPWEVEPRFEGTSLTSTIDGRRVAVHTLRLMAPVAPRRSNYWRLRIVQR